MFPSIARWIVSFALAFALLLGAVHLVGSALPASPALTVVAQSPCTLPCVYGVTPGITTESQVLQDLAAYEVDQVANDEIEVVLVDQDETRIVVTFHSNAMGRIKAIRLRSKTQVIPLAHLSDLLLIGLKPNHVIHECRWNRTARLLITFGVHDELEALVTVRDTFSPRTSITMLDVATGDWRPGYDTRNVFACSITEDWRGFAPLWKYFA